MLALSQQHVMHWVGGQFDTLATPADVLVSVSALNLFHFGYNSGCSTVYKPPDYAHALSDIPLFSTRRAPCVRRSPSMTRDGIKTSSTVANMDTRCHPHLSTPRITAEMNTILHTTKRLVLVA